MKKRLKEEAISSGESNLYVCVDHDQNLIYPATVVRNDTDQIIVKVTPKHYFKVSRRQFYSRQKASFLGKDTQVHVRCQIDEDYPKLNSYWGATVIDKKYNTVLVRYKNSSHGESEWVKDDDVYIMIVVRI